MRHLCVVLALHVVCFNDVKGAQLVWAFLEHGINKQCQVGWTAWLQMEGSVAPELVSGPIVAAARLAPGVVELVYEC